ncbi:MAG TPA: lipase family protein [Candidatus Omnitrophota bacterium]|nr:lipase family protein [Candidatus Omnitrophota bacterium]HPS21022.1 lipase family protein [Candidatus Omnitrophota bacterium]
MIKTTAKIKFNVIVGLSFMLFLSSAAVRADEIQMDGGGKVIKTELKGQYSCERLNSIFKDPRMGLDTSRYGFSPAENTVALYKIKYVTTNPKKNNVEEKVSGLIAVPIGIKGPVPLLIYMHATDFSRNATPSNPELFPEAQVVVTVFAGRGYAVFMPDYIGKGDSKVRHTYMIADCEARCGSDMIIAGKAVCEEMGVSLSGDIFLSGWSQGAHSAMALARMLQEEKYPGVRAVAAISGPYDMYLTWCQWLKGPTAKEVPSLIAYIILAYEEYYAELKGLADSAERDGYKDLSMAIFDTDNLDENVIGQFGRVPGDILKDDFSRNILEGKNDFVRILKENEVYKWRPEMPVRFYYGGGDLIVSPMVAKTAYLYQKEHGAKVDIVSAGDNASHPETFFFGISGARKWFDAIKK